MGVLDFERRQRFGAVECDLTVRLNRTRIPISYWDVQFAARRVVYLWLALILVGCACSRSKDRRVTFAPPLPTLQPQAVGTVDHDIDSSICIYYLDHFTGHAMRVSPDGKVRELVVACEKRGLQSLGTHTDDGDGGCYLSMSSVPDGRGWLFLDRTNLALMTVWRWNEPRDPIVPPVTIMANVPTALNLRFVRGELPVADHSHRVPASVTIVNNHGTDRTFRFRSHRVDFRWFIGMLDRHHALVFDPPNVIVWSIDTGEQTTIANADRLRVFPRDLRAKERFSPIARTYDGARVYKWTMKDPYDFNVKPEYEIEPPPPRPGEGWLTAP